MSNQVKIIVIVAVIAVISLGGFLLLRTSSDNASNTVSNNSDTSSPSAETENIQDEIPSFTIEEVAQKNTKDECWTIIAGSVYDLTSYIPRHPGGDEILLACGADGSSLFNERKTNSGEIVGSGTPHSSSSANQLQSLFIGTIQ
jgi:cytochrome b involved in lipid metabolism